MFCEDIDKLKAWCDQLGIERTKGQHANTLRDNLVAYHKAQRQAPATPQVQDTPPQTGVPSTSDLLRQEWSNT